MSKDNQAIDALTDKKGFDTTPSDTSALTRLQDSAGLHDKVTNLPDKGSDIAKDGASLVWQRPHDVMGRAGEAAAVLGKLSSPTDLERITAEKTLENGMSKLIPEADRNAMKAMTNAITSGDSKAFAEAVKNAGADPEKLKQLVGEVNKSLEDKHCSTRLDVTGDGKVLVGDKGKDTALAFDPKTGKVEAKSVEYNMDGSILVKPGEVLHADTDQTFKDIGDRAVDGVNGKLGFPGERAFNIDAGDQNPGRAFSIHAPFPRPGDRGHFVPVPIIPEPFGGGSAHPADHPADHAPISAGGAGTIFKDQRYKPIEM